MKLKPLLAVVCAAQVCFGQSFFAKGISKLAKVVGNFQAVKVSSLDDIVATGAFGSNLHTDKVGEMSQTFFSHWKTGGDAVFVMFSKKNQSGYFKIDGTVNVDGKPLEYLTSGMYGMAMDASPSGRTIEVTTTSGQKGSFKMEPSKRKVTLVSINGQKDGEIKLDLSKDAVLELAYPPEMENGLMKVSLAINQIGIKSMVDVCFLRAAHKVTVPAGAFRNIAIAPASSVLYSFKGSYLSVGTEYLDTAKEVTGAFKTVAYTNHYDDGKLVTVTQEPKLKTGLVVKGKDDQLDIQYYFFKPDAFWSRPFDHMKTVGLKSFVIRGTTYSQTSSTTETSTTITTTTTTLQFPKQPDAVWDSLMERMYPDFIEVVQSELGTTLLPVEKVTGTEAYQFMNAFASDDKNTKVDFARAFRNTKVMSAFMPVTEGYGSNGANAKIMNQSGADGLLTMTMDLEISSAKGGLIIMIPKFAFEIVGKSNGPTIDTKYCSGTLQSGSGVGISKNVNLDELEKIIRKGSMLKVFRKGLHELVEKEKADGDYGPVWALQK